MKKLSTTFIYKALLSVLFVGGVGAVNAQTNSQTASTAKVADADRGYLVKVGDQAPDDFELVLDDGQKTSLKQLRGKVVVLQFTASWCSVCRKEMPHLETDVWNAYKDKNVVLIGVDRDEPLEKVQKFRKDIQVSYPLALDPGADIFGRFADKKAGVTRNVVIDSNGKIVFLTRLYDVNEFNTMVKVIDGLAGKASLKASL
ncbi:TlpA family protein disulfide reductase [Mucilaginibacter daejeonensis]|uniref:peroxiredoxin family protein n=1 Tax=Mucilaginibacter daejeonensis TaxID=398049 RepID=UPI001D176E02|nr:TlpA disulfide reductase family protein [Mucilaginibacter daejeonensis]UEG54819.1 TlpA family protein disulfide reductase [Mucilaginibacter daejeonensis]